MTEERNVFDKEAPDLLSELISVIRRHEAGDKEVAPSKDLRTDISDYFNHRHIPIQHRDGKEAWCPSCGLTLQHKEPKSLLGDARDKYLTRNRIKENDDD